MRGLYIEQSIGPISHSCLDFYSAAISDVLSSSKFPSDPSCPSVCWLFLKGRELILILLSEYLLHRKIIFLHGLSM